MSPILAGAVTALAYAVSTLASARATRQIGSPATVAGVMLVGSIVLVPIALTTSPISPVPGVPVEALLWAVLAGVSNVMGLLVAYVAYRIGAVGIVSTIGSTEGAVAAVLSVLAGQALAPGSGPVLVLVVLGVLLAATSGGHEIEEGVAISRAQSLRAAGLAGCAALLFGLGLFIMGRWSTSLPSAWLILPGRLVGLVAVGLPVLVIRRVRIARSAWPFIVAIGCAEVIGMTFYSIGARQDIAVTSVLASMFAPLAAIAAFVLFRERLAPRQIAGIVLVAVGIAILGLLAR